MKLFGSLQSITVLSQKGGDPPLRNKERDMHYLGLDIGQNRRRCRMRMAGRFAVTAARRKVNISTICLCVVALIEQIRRTFNDRCDRDRLTRQYLATHWPD